MITQLRMDDDLYATYEEEATERNLSVADVLLDRLNRAQALDPRSRYVLLTDNARDQMEQLVGGGSLRSAEDLLQKVRRMNRVGFGSHELELTAGQMEEIVFRSTKMGRTVDELLKETWKQFTEQFFTLVGQVKDARQVAG